MNLRACRDGWAGRMGRRIEPDADARHERKAGAPEGATRSIASSAIGSAPRADTLKEG